MDNETTRIVDIRVDNASAIKGIAEYTEKLEAAKNAEMELTKKIKERGNTTQEDREQLAKIQAVQTYYLAAHMQQTEAKKPI